MDSPIPISVIIVTRNEAHNILRCLNSLSGFNDVWVVDSKSGDETIYIAQECGAQIVDFEWNGQYPKKRQWCLDTLNLKYEHVLFIDADEEMTPALMVELQNLDFACDGYFIKARYCVNGGTLKHGLQNKKLCLFNRYKFEFPIVDDLDIEGMGEIEGHYQPVPKETDTRIGTLKNTILHHAFDDETRWLKRHEGYARWEDAMRMRQAYPHEVSFIRRALKTVFNKMPAWLRATVVYVYGSVFRLGVLDGKEGLYICAMKARYYLRKIR